MSESIIVAIVTGLIPLIGVLASNSSTAKLTAYKIEEVKKDIQTLSERVDKHNNLVSRMAVVESKLNGGEKQ